MTDDPDDDPALAPSADTRGEKRRRLTAGKGVLLVIAGVAILAFALYLLIGVMTLSSA
jgi:hypothetical protein